MKSLSQFSEIPPILNAAIEAGGGRYVCADKGTAFRWRWRVNQYRRALRRLEEQRYAHVPGYSISTPYDNLVLRITKDEPNVVLIEFTSGPGVLLDKAGNPVHVDSAAEAPTELDEEAALVARELDLDV